MLNQGRTLCFLNDNTVKKTLEDNFGDVLNFNASKDDKKIFCQCDTIESCNKVLDYLKNTLNIDRIKVCNYSLFIRSKLPDAHDELDKLLLTYNNLLVTYKRLNGNIGKLCVDNYDDYNSLKNLQNDIFVFYPFNVNYKHKKHYDNNARNNNNVVRNNDARNNNNVVRNNDARNNNVVRNNDVVRNNNVARNNNDARNNNVARNNNTRNNNVVKNNDNTRNNKPLESNQPQTQTQTKINTLD